MNGKLRVFPLQFGEPGERFHACLQGAVMRSGIDDIAVNQRIHGKDGVAALPRILEKPGPERVDIRRLFLKPIQPTGGSTRATSSVMPARSAGNS
jgi:hypothetical protein